MLILKSQREILRELGLNAVRGNIAWMGGGGAGMNCAGGKVCPIGKSGKKFLENLITRDGFACVSGIVDM